MLAFGHRFSKAVQKGGQRVTAAVLLLFLVLFDLCPAVATGTRKWYMIRKKMKLTFFNIIKILA